MVNGDPVAANPAHGNGRAAPLPIPILLYHSVSVAATPRYRDCMVTPAAFAGQMAYLRDNGFTPITVTQFVAARAGREVFPERPVVLTFDDGLADFATGALPVLLRHHFPATLYVATGFVGGTSRWLDAAGEGDRPMLTWGQIAELAAAGIECGAHGHNHRQLDLLPLAEARDEIVRSKTILEQRLDRPVTSFAYPYGYFSAAIRRLVRVAGFSSACAVRQVLSSTADHPLMLGRIAITPDLTLARFAALLAGRDLYLVSSARERPRSVARRVQLRLARRLRAWRGAA